MAHEAQLEWERRAGRAAAVAAFAAVLLPIAAGFYTSSSVEGPLDTAPKLLGAFNRHGTDFVVGAALQGLGLLCLIGPLGYLFRAAKFRRSDLPQVALVLTVAAPFLLLAAGVLGRLDGIEKAHEFFSSGPRTEDRAEDVLRDVDPVTQGLGLGGALALAFSVVMISLSAMRAGLLSRFMGIVGIVVGALIVLGSLVPGGGPQIVQIFWVGAVGFLILGRWPGGRGPAWDSGEAEPWPSAAEVRARATGQSAQASRRADRENEPEEAEPSDGRGDQRSSNARKRKRKSKRRRRLSG